MPASTAALTRPLTRTLWSALFGASAAAPPAVPAPTFHAPLLSTLVPTLGAGAGTLTRAGTATVTDFEGVTRIVVSGEARFHGARRVRNYFTRSEGGIAVDSGTTPPTSSVGAYGGKTNANIINLPAGVAGETACKSTTFNNVNATVPPGDYRFSVHLALSRPLVGAESVRVYMGTNLFAPIDLVAGMQPGVAFVRFANAAPVVSFGTGNVAPTVYPLTALDAPITVFMWGYQLEAVTAQANQNPSEYVSVAVLASPFHGAGADGVKYFSTTNGNSVASNVITEASGVAIPDATLLGYLSEGARTNIALQSQTLGTAWQTYSGGGAPAPTLTPDLAVAPDGTMTADRLAFPAVSGVGVYSIIYQQQALAANTYSFSFWLKGAVGGERVYLTFQQDTSTFFGTKACVLTTQWQRFVATVTLTAAQYYSLGIDLRDLTQAATAAQTIYAWGGQVEAGPFASSYIPTTTVAVTRPRDALSFVSGSVPAIPHSAYTETIFNGIDFSVPAVPLSANTYYNQWLRNETPTSLTQYADLSSPQAATLVAGLPTLAVGQMKRQSQSVTATRVNGASNGIVGAGITGTFVMSTSGQLLYVGAINDGRYPQYGTIRNVKFWNVALTDAQLQAMTT